MNLKRTVYEELDRVAAPETIFASNTSTLPITEIAGVTGRKGQVIGVHFFNPPQLMKLVEVIPGSQTSGVVVSTIQEFVKSLGKTPVLCRRDVPGFIVNRLFIPMVHEALYSVERQGTSREAMDSAVRFELGFPMGIFELADFTGLDVIHKASGEMSSRDEKVLRSHPAWSSYTGTAGWDKSPGLAFTSTRTKSTSGWNFPRSWRPSAIRCRCLPTY